MENGSNDDTLIGTTIDGRFRLEEKLGEGAVGRVYRSTQVSIDRSVAIKILHGEYRRDEEYQKRFRREANAISGFNHPNIVRLIDYGEDSTLELTYLAMEFVEGIDLQKALEFGRFDVRFALEVTEQIASGLAAAHDAGIIHRDLKPSNIILVSVTGGVFQAKVLDFGVAFPTGDDAELTSEGRTLGTPAYMAPEQGLGQPVLPQSDIYSLGVTLYTMLSGQLPFEGDSGLEVMVKHIRNQPSPLVERTPIEDVPPGLEQLLDRFLAKEPRARFESGREVRNQIKRLRAEHGWEELEVDTSLTLEEALEHWVVPRDAPRLVRAPSEGHDEGERDSQRSTTIDVAPPETPDPGLGVETHDQSTPHGAALAERRAEDRGGRITPGSNAGEASEPRDSDQRPDELNTSSSATSVETLQAVAILLLALAVLLSGVIAGWYLFTGAESTSSAAAAGAGGSDAGTGGDRAREKSRVEAATSQDESSKDGGTPARARTAQTDAAGRAGDVEPSDSSVDRRGASARAKVGGSRPPAKGSQSDPEVDPGHRGVDDRGGAGSSGSSEGAESTDAGAGESPGAAGKDPPSGGESDRAPREGSPDAVDKQLREEFERLQESEF